MSYEGYEYPTEEDEEKITKWQVAANGWEFAHKAHELMEFVLSKWWRPEWGWRRSGGRYWISTGGWSGNESLITAMERNFIFWSMCWQTHRVGGHYTFKVGKMGGKSKTKRPAVVHWPTKTRLPVSTESATT